MDALKAKTEIFVADCRTSMQTTAIEKTYMQAECLFWRAMHLAASAKLLETNAELLEVARREKLMEKVFPVMPIGLELDLRKRVLEETSSVQMLLLSLKGEKNKIEANPPPIPSEQAKLNLARALERLDEGTILCHEAQEMVNTARKIVDELTKEPIKA